MIRYLGVVQARLSSSRLPGKVLLRLGDTTLLHQVFLTVRESALVDNFVLATSNEMSDDPIIAHAEELGIDWHRGDLNDVTRRFHQVCLFYNPVNIVRITADNPLMDGRVIDSAITAFESHPENIDYFMFSNAVHGLSAEIFSFSALRETFELATDPADREHVTTYMRRNLETHTPPIFAPFDRPEITASIDTMSDFLRMSKYYQICRASGQTPDINTYISFVDKAEYVAD